MFYDKLFIIPLANTCVNKFIEKMAKLFPLFKVTFGCILDINSIYNKQSLISNVTDHNNITKEVLVDGVFINDYNQTELYFRVNPFESDYIGDVTFAFGNYGYLNETEKIITYFTQSELLITNFSNTIETNSSKIMDVSLTKKNYNELYLHISGDIEIKPYGNLKLKNYLTFNFNDNPYLVEDMNYSIDRIIDESGSGITVTFSYNSTNSSLLYFNDEF